jgi:biopolymer transport protein ExbD
MARKTPEINGGSMADIAFLLLIFFLVATTMDIDTGIMRQLPPPPDPTVEPPEIKERNVFVVLINAQDRLFVENRVLQVGQLRKKTKEFLTNPRRSDNLSEQETFGEKLKEAKEKGESKKIADLQRNIELLGSDVSVSKGVISLRNDRGTSYNMYIQVQNELAAAVRELRDEMAEKNFGKKFDDLTNEEQVEAVKDAVPMPISEAEPKDVGGSK